MSTNRDDTLLPAAIPQMIDAAVPDALEPAAPSVPGTRPAPAVSYAPVPDAGFDAGVLYRTEIARLSAVVCALRAQVDRERRRRQSVIDQYETILDGVERDRDADRDREARSETGSRKGLFDQLRG